jgi:hypothetical protein
MELNQSHPLLLFDGPIVDKLLSEFIKNVRIHVIHLFIPCNLLSPLHFLSYGTTTSSSALDDGGFFHKRNHLERKVRGRHVLERDVLGELGGSYFISEPAERNVIVCHRCSPRCPR